MALTAALPIVSFADEQTAVNENKKTYYLGNGKLRFHVKINTVIQRYKRIL